MFSRIFALIALVGTLCVFQPVYAENLNQKYGPSWDCSYISFGEPIYDACKRCDMKTQDFYRDSATTGHCVPKEGVTTPPVSSAPSYTPSPPSSSTPQKRLWSAIAAGIESNKVSAGLGENYSTKAEAEAAAIQSCQKNISSCKVVGAWNAGCYYITVSEGAQNVAWGSGTSAQAAYNECYKRVKGGNCKTKTIGGCYPN